MVKSDIEQQFLQRMIEISRDEEHKKFGKLIIQTNEIHWYLSMVVVLRSASPDKGYQDYLYGGIELGMLINLFNACSKSIVGVSVLIEDLKKYNKNRNRLAHKMFSTKKLTVAECAQSIKEGEILITHLKTLLKNEIGDFEEGTK